jgi:hypothetical protein
VLFAGASAAKFKATGRTLVSGTYTEYTVSVTLSQPISLSAGTYFLNVMPQCTDSTACSSQYVLYQSSVEDATPAHHHGPANIIDETFWNSNFFGFDYDAATSAGGCSVGTCDLFSFGVVGTCTVDRGGAACPF